MSDNPAYYTRETLPERNLICAFLLRAWADLDHPNRFIQSDAYYWVVSKKKTLGHFFGPVK
jgi:hypothetical protein